MAAFVNGRFVELEAAMVPALDRGFLFGDGVYELIPVYGGRLFRLDEHLARLGHSLTAVRIPEPYGPARWREILTELVARAGGGDLSVYLQITRGSAPREHAFPEPIEPTVFAMANALAPVAPHDLEHGLAAVTLEDIRWHRCDIKSVSLLANVLLRQRALDAGAAEAILVRDGKATEGAASNVFAVMDGAIVTPPKSPDLLPGITRDMLLELIQGDDLAWRETDITQSDLAAADEVWLTSSSKEVIAVTTLDGKPVGEGVPGPLWRHVHALFQAYKDTIRASADN